MGKNRRENKPSLSETLACECAVRNKQLCGRPHGMTHFEAAQREKGLSFLHTDERKSWVCGRKDRVLKSLEESHQAGLVRLWFSIGDRDSSSSI